MSQIRRRTLLLGGFALVMAGVVGCGPVAEPTTPPQATATTAAVNPTPTTGANQPTSTAALQATPSVQPGLPGTAGPKDRGSIQPVPVVAAPPANPNAQKGGILRKVTTNYPPDWTHWEATNGATSQATTPLHDGLVEYNAYEKDKGEVIIPNLAYDWWLSQDGLTWTFKLVKGAKFHNGTEMTCADAKFMIDTIKDGQDDTGSQMRSSPRATYIKRVGEVTCADDYTLLVNSAEPLPSLLKSLAVGNFSIYPKAVFEGHLPEMVDKEGPTIGPFVVEEKVAGDRVTFKRNPNYWNQPYPYLDGIELQNLGSRTAAYAAFRVGRAEQGQVPPGNYQQEIDRGFFTVQEGSRAGGYFMDINGQRAPFNDPKVRLAMRCAFNSASYVQTAFNGFARADMGVWPYDSPWALPQSDVARIHPCLNKDASMDERRSLGRKLMVEAGFGPNNRLTADMLIRGTTFVYDPVVTDFAEVYIDTVPRVQEVAAAYKSAYSGEFDIHPSGFITANKDPDQWMYEHYYSTSDRNYGKWSNPEVDALLDQQSRTLDPAKRLDLVRRANLLISENTGKLIMAHYQQPTFSAPWLMDWYFVDPSITAPSEKFTRVWIDRAKIQQAGG